MAAVLWKSESTLHFVDGLASLYWIDLRSPFGASPSGLDVVFHVPKGVEILDLHHRPVFGVGPDAHRPVVERDENRVQLSFTAALPGDEIIRRPITHPLNWTELFFPVIIRADHNADGAALRIERHALGDKCEDNYDIEISSDPGVEPPVHGRRQMELSYWPWLSSEEQEALGFMLRRCGITDVSLNWFDHGIPRLPESAYSLGAKRLRESIPSVKIWIDGMPGADTLIDRAEDTYGRSIPMVASPEACLSKCPDLVVASVRSWCNAVDADGVIVSISEPSARDTDYMPAHCFSDASRTRFAQEEGLDTVPQPLTILHHYHDAWVAFCCRQIRRLLELTRLGIGSRPLALQAVGPGGIAREEASVDWRDLGEVVDIAIYTHTTEALKVSGLQHWGHSYVGSTPQCAWEHWHGAYGTIKDREMVGADMKMQFALSGENGVRLSAWNQLDGRIQQQLLEWR